MRSAHWLVVALLAVVAACGAEYSLDETQPGVGTSASSCTNPADPACCPKEALRCTGDPDGKLVCTCASLWDCSKAPQKCTIAMPVPPGSGSWQCSWTNKAYVCTGKTKPSLPAGDSTWKCTQTILDKVLGTWTCQSEFPPNPGNAPSGASTWKCSVDNELDQLQCEKTTTSTTPPAGSDAGVAPPPPPPPPQPGQECVPGTKRWCDGEIYCGWGIQDCKPDGTWEDKCVEAADGRRPSTKCACYHLYYEEKCCETPDCILPKGTNGQICGDSDGLLCSYCNPQKPYCVEPGGKCVLTTVHESFCSKACSSGAPCPSGYYCKNGQCVPTKGTCL